VVPPGIEPGTHGFSVRTKECQFFTLDAFIVTQGAETGVEIVKSPLFSDFVRKSSL